ncbi:hypothetical protein [Streptomyces sp. SHP 1-2]|uniref:hypothetical protein n=1 Tax=Streptomyces sp. SHP 1-2 TaxID=2769489 RepID=UPI002238B39A|nr:hypothetical protein [Streptomyces sp. SHP 1-2]MCW5250394.1 hypothetical protein [Streptomyces sp. SHP 1-2]
MTAAEPGAGRALRRAVELGHHTASLREELAEWRSEAADDGALIRHRSQVESVVRILSAGLDRLEALPEGPRRDLLVPEAVLDLHHVGDFLRGKLLLRRVPRYRDFLTVADELAWSVYEPARRAAGGTRALREPPLTFLSREPVPFAAARGSGFTHLLPPGGLRTRGGLEAGGRLPFPVIGVPWSTSRHLPAVLAVAHEAGHHVEDDFGLAPALAERLRTGAGLDRERAAVWEPWLGEVFADVCATLACGTAYVWTLADVLAAAGDGGGAGADRYPPAGARLAACRAALPPDPEERLPEDPPGGAAGDGAGEEAAAVVRALLADGFEELGGARLGQVLRPAGPAELADAADSLLAGLSTGRGDVPGVLAAAALAFVRDPRGYDAADVDGRARREVLRLVPREPRSAPGGAAEVAARDAAAAEDLLALLGIGP